MPPVCNGRNNCGWAAGPSVLKHGDPGLVMVGANFLLRWASLWFWCCDGEGLLSFWFLDCLVETSHGSVKEWSKRLTRGIRGHPASSIWLLEKAKTQKYAVDAHRPLCHYCKEAEAVLPDVRGYLWGKSDGLNCYGRQGENNLATFALQHLEQHPA